MATHPILHTWRIPWTEEPGGLQFMGMQLSDMTEQRTLSKKLTVCIRRRQILDTYSGE